MTDHGSSLGVHWGKIVARTWSDDEFKSRVLSEPREVLAEEGFVVPDDVDVTVSDGGRSKVHLVVSPMPEGIDTQVDDDTLESMSGGVCSCCCCCGSAAGTWP